MAGDTSYFGHKKHVEIVDGPNGLTLRASMKHGPGDLHTLQLSPGDIHNLRLAARRQLNRLQPSVSSGAFQGEEDERGVGAWSARHGVSPLDVSGCSGAELMGADELGLFGKKFRRRLARGFKRGLAGVSVPFAAVLETPFQPVQMLTKDGRRRGPWRMTRRIARVAAGR